MTTESNSSTFSIVDAHLHFYDSGVNRHGFLEAVDPVYEALVGDYSALPTNYLPDAYLADSTGCTVQGVVWHEYLSDDTLEETRWAQRLAAGSPVAQAMVALVDFLDPQLTDRLAAYRALPNVSAVREHLGWDTANPLKRFARRPDLLADPAWERGLAALRSHDFKCGLEVFSPQLPDLLKVVRRHAEQPFTLAVMGWPLDLSSGGFAQWRRDTAALARCENVCADISAIECIFGMDWSEAQIAPWVMSLIEQFGPGRIMFGSHLPIAGLSGSFASLYDAYRRIVSGFSASEQDQMFRTVAANWFRLRQPRAERASRAADEQ
jgi:predicted TIM-barrel fold metal-dependent hydrolase